jgi:hypothetical protein
MTTIARQLKITKFPFYIEDINKNEIYCEHRTGFWRKSEYDSNGNIIYFENSTGYWIKTEYNSEGIRIYYEDYSGLIEDNRVVELTMDEIAKKLGIDVKYLKIKK